MLLLRRLLFYFTGIAIFAYLPTTYAQSDESEPACQAYICMLNSELATDVSCAPLINKITDLFSVGSHTVTCGPPSKDAPLMQVIHRQANKDFCRPDLRDDKDNCNATTALDFLLEGSLYTRQWRLKVAAPITEYYEGTSAPTYTTNAPSQTEQPLPPGSATRK